MNYNAYKSYKSCAVPQCKNTSIKTPTKVFVYVPNDKTMRNKWLKLARRDPTTVSLSSSMYFCEDHFDLPKDMANYMQYKIMGSVKQVKMIKGCLPSKFECHKTGTSKTSIPQSAVVKRTRLERREVERILEERINEELKKQETIKQAKIKVFKIEPEEDRAETVSLSNFTKTSIFKIKEEPKEPEELSNLPAEDFIWLDDVKVELPSVETDTSDYLGNENIECETEIKVKQEFEQIEFISFPNIQYESNDYSNCNVKEENTKLKKKKTSTERVRRFHARRKQIMQQQESLQKGQNSSMEVEEEALNINNPNSISVNIATQNPEMCLEYSCERNKYSCDVCDFKSTLKKNILKHKRVYIDIRPSESDKCEYSPNCKRRLNSRVKTQASKDLYRCNMCGFKTKNKEHFE